MTSTATPCSSLAPVSSSQGHWTPYFVSSDTREIREMVGQNITAHTLEHKSTQRRPVTANFRTVSIGTLTFHEMAYSMFGEGEAIIHAPEMTNIYLCEINLAGDMSVGSKNATIPFRAGEIYMINANTPHTKIWHSDGRQLMIRIHQTDMEMALERLTGMPVQGPLLFDARPQPVTGPANALSRMIELLRLDLERGGSIFAGPDAAGAKQIVLDLMLKALPNNHMHLLSNPGPIVRPRHVRYAAEYIHDHAEQMITLAELVAASGMSKRSLHAGFQKYYGFSPMTYLRNVRLDRARLLLSRQAVGVVSVTGIALQCGFTHLSNFARVYRERFGELPSETLRNA